MRTTLLFVAALVVGLMTVPTSVAQISITGDDFLGLIGKSFTVQDTLAEPPGGIPVNVGSAGANQSWDFSDLVVGGFTSTRLFLDPASTPYAGDYPGANFVISQIAQEDTFAIQSYEFLFVDNSGLTEFGFVLESGDSTIYEDSDDPSGVALPVSFNTTWSEVEVDTTEFSGIMNVNIDSTVNTADAWGSVTLPSGTYDALRLRTDDKFTTETYVNGVLISSNTSTSIGYEWISKEQFIVVAIEGQDDDPNPNFTMASYVTMITATTTDVVEDNYGQSAVLKALYPNPFSSSLTIEMESTVQGGNVSVFDLLGRRVRTLETSGSAGNQTIVWNGRTDSGSKASPGMYLIRVESNNRVETHQVVLTR